jgi:hypothetical protein
MVVNLHVLEHLNHLKDTCEIPDDAPTSARIPREDSRGSNREVLDLEELQMLIDEYQMRCDLQDARLKGVQSERNSEQTKEEYQKIAHQSFALEREAIGKEYEDGIITREDYDHYIKNISLTEFVME